jgi:hypothetical protein
MYCQYHQRGGVLTYEMMISLMPLTVNVLNMLKFRCIQLLFESFLLNMKLQHGGRAMFAFIFLFDGDSEQLVKPLLVEGKLIFVLKIFHVLEVRKTTAIIFRFHLTNLIEL